MLRDVAAALHLPQFAATVRQGVSTVHDVFKPAESTPPPDTRPWHDQTRPAVLLNQAPDGKVTLGNVRWGFMEGGKDWKPLFRDTTIDPSKVKNVYICLERFPPEFIAAHSFLYFDFGQDAAVSASNGESDNGLCVSMEARTRVGQNFDLIKGVENQFGSIYSVSTWKDTVQKTCRQSNHPVERYPLSLNQEQKEKLLQYSLHEALVDRTGEHYNTLNNSCFTNAIRQVNTVLPWYNRIKHNLVTAIPVNAGPILDLHRLVPADAHITITEPPGRTDKVPGFATPQQIERWWTPALKAAGAVTFGLLGTLLPGNVVTGGLGAGLGYTTGKSVAHSLQRTVDRRFERSDEYPIPPQTPEELASCQVH